MNNIMNTNILELLLSLGVWNWLILGAVLLLIEIAAPGMFMLWLGIAALLVGLISFFVDWPWQAQLVAFAVFSMASVPLWRRFSRDKDPETDHPFLNRRNEGLVGQVFTLEQPIANGVGTVRIGDTIWRVLGTDCPAGSRVRVRAAHGAELHVEPAA